MWRDGLLDVLQDGLAGRQARLLRHEADGGALVRPRLAHELLVLAGHDLAAAWTCPAPLQPITPILRPGRRRG